MTNEVVPIKATRKEGIMIPDVAGTSGELHLDGYVIKKNNHYPIYMFLI
jgi:hypothetical protein